MNKWNNIIPGLTQGLQNLGAGFIQKADKNDASKLYEGITGSYDKMNELRNKAIDVIQNNGEIKQPDYQGEGVVTGETMPQRTQTQENPNELIGQLYKGIIQKTGELSQNPYGKPYIDLIDKFYGQKPKYTTQFDKTNNMMITYDEQGNIIKSQRYAKEKLPEKKVKDFKLTEGTQFRQNEDGTWTAWNPIETGELQPTEYKLTDAEYQKAFGEKPEFKTTGFKSRGIGKNPMDDMNNKEKQMHTDLEAYRKALETGNNAEANRIFDKFAGLGLDINQLNNEYDYTGKDLKKQTGFLKEKVRQSEQINQSYNEVYKHLNMDSWWKDLYSATSTDDLISKVSWYEQYLQQSVFPNVPPEVGKVLWSELQKAKANVYNNKGFK